MDFLQGLDNNHHTNNNTNDNNNNSNSNNTNNFLSRVSRVRLEAARFESEGPALTH